MKTDFKSAQIHAVLEHILVFEWFKASRQIQQVN